ncbi:DUF1636 family protein [Rhodovulum sp. DZ06]|uniref:DUF1636 family protein n=1 Tax=Rhodovulum sp. DZ06 TaxID=3425126 RepID=UPI003D3419C0
MTDSPAAEIAATPQTDDAQAADAAPAPNTPETAPVELLVCVKCRRGSETPEGGIRPGQALHDALAAADLPPNVALRAVECLSNCDHGCSVALRGGPKRWTYVYGNCHEAETAETLREGVALYAATENGLIPWRTRPEHLKRNCIARIPPLED